MNNLQVYTPYDPLINYKIYLNKKYNCMFFEHNTNTITNINCGMKELDIYHEKIITDGNIEVINKSEGKPTMICENKIITFDKGLSLSIKISNSTFFINIVRKNTEKVYEIHMNEESRELIDNIIKYIYYSRTGIDTSAIALYYPDTIKTTNYEEDIKTENYYYYSEKKNKLRIKKKKR